MKSIAPLDEDTDGRNQLDSTIQPGSALTTRDARVYLMQDYHHTSPSKVAPYIEVKCKLNSALVLHSQPSFQEPLTASSITSLLYFTICLYSFRCTSIFHVRIANKSYLSLYLTLKKLFIMSTHLILSPKNTVSNSKHETQKRQKHNTEYLATYLV